jgi:hypothetical protein
VVILNQNFLAEEPKIGGLHDYIFTLPRETLVKWAFTTEKYHREVNQVNPRGGLHDYIQRLSNQEIINIILKEVDEHPELDSKDKLESLINKYQVSNGPVIGGDGGLHDIIFRLPRETLNTWALTTEAYHRDINHQHLLGGLDDYISSLSNEQVIDYIMKEIKEHPEIAFKAKLDGLAKKYNINSNSVHEVSSQQGEVNMPGADGGLHDVIATMKRRDLVDWAFALEHYHNGGPVLGGLHDYIFNLSNEEVKARIIKELGEHREINTMTHMQELMNKFNQAKNATFKLFAGEDKISSQVKTLDRRHTLAYALSMDHYDSEKNPDKMGGIDDFVDAMHTEELKLYITKYLQMYPELDSIAKCEELMKKYGIEFKD